MREVWRNLGFTLLLATAGMAWGRVCKSPAEALSSPANSDAQVGFQFENSQLQPAKYRFVIHEDGSGEFHSEPAAVPPLDTTSYQPLAGPLDRPVQMSKPIVEEMFSTARRERFFAVECQNDKDKVAYQGTKQLSYKGPDGRGSCRYNWSRIVAIQKLTSTFQSIAFTLEEGRRIEVEQKHDRLALDAEIGMLSDAVKEGRAMEIENIRSVLESIIEDETVLERARSRAQKLLEGSGVSSASLPSP